eukprot:m.88945 g.88945  ORF g.88945 m.88945 type:complete len:757 (-) comp9776_c1_seq1:103-2373(-)
MTSAVVVRRRGANRQPGRVERRAACVALALVGIVLYAGVATLINGNAVAEGDLAAYADGAHENGGGRSLLATGADWEKCSFEKGANIGGWIVLYIVIVIHVFIGIAILADDYFVPSLEAISHKLDLSEDVAGATFMAAGSSAPELFTGLAGAAVESDVGVGTIVGSAVFNILVIVALSGALAGSVLLIDWTAILRDSVFYGLSIVLFIIFAWDGYFEWWEGLVMTLAYGFYIYAMKVNQDVRSWLLRKYDSNKIAPEAEPKSKPSDGDIEKATLALPPSSSQGPSSTPPDSAIGDGDEDDIADLAISPDTPAHAVGSPPPKHALVARLQAEEGTGTLQKHRRSSSLDAKNFRKLVDGGDATTTESSQDKDGQNLTLMHNFSASDTMLAARPRSVDSAGNERPSFHHAHVHNISSFVTGSKRTSKTAGMGVKHSLHDHVHPHGSSSAVKPVGSPLASPEPPTQSQQPTRDSTHTTVSVSDEDEEEQERLSCGQRCCVPCVYGDHPSAAEGEGPWSVRAKWFGFIVSAPYVWLFTNTIPTSFRAVEEPEEDDGKRHKKESFSRAGNGGGSDGTDASDPPQLLHHYKGAFFMCILWIMVLSFIMVLFVIRIGCIIGIDDYVMGLVIVAAGTSIPDALSSILVAQDGAGSMAVSNAIGSNVFDINLGIGIPFMLRALILKEKVDLLDEADRAAYKDGDIIDHVKFGLILLGLLLVTISAFKISHFRLTKPLGFTLFALYVVFITYALVHELVCKRNGYEC